MAAVATSILKYPNADFTTSGGTVNVALLSAELGELALSPGLDFQSAKERAGTTVITLAGNAAQADIDLIDAAVSAHTGEPFVQTEFDGKNETVQATVDTTEVEALKVQSAALPEGKYLVQWYSELRTSADGVMEALIRQKTQDLALHTVDGVHWRAFSGQTLVNVKAGKKVIARIFFRMVSGTGPAELRRASLSVCRFGG